METFSPAYKRYALVVMTLVCALNVLDRGVMMMLIQPIKEDLQLSDTQLGFVTGIVFGLFYATMGVPIARWADRGNRVTITSLAMGIWGLTVMACMLVTNYVQLVLARIAAAVGESGGQPPTYSLLGDYFPNPAERTSAMYVYHAAGPVTLLASFALSGWLNELYGWRMTFFLMGIPGLLMAAVVRLTLVEPRVEPKAVSAPMTVPMSGVLAVLWRQRSCRNLAISMILLFTMSQGLGPWYAAFMMRSHGMRTAELGIWMGFSFGISGIVAIFLGAFVISRWFAKHERRQVQLAAFAVASAAPCLLAFLMIPQRYLALSALIPVNLLMTAFLPPLFVLLQRLVPAAMRATLLMVILFLANFVGMGIGPQLVGILSDLLAPALGLNALRYAMLIVSVLALAAAYQLWRVGQTINEDLQKGSEHLWRGKEGPTIDAAAERS